MKEDFIHFLNRMERRLLMLGKNKKNSIIVILDKRDFERLLESIKYNINNLKNV